MDDFLKFFTIAFCMSSIIGPVSVLCIKQTIHHGFKAGMACGLGANTAETFYSIVAAFSIVIISSFLIEHQFYFRLVGGAVLLYLGAKSFFSHIKKQEKIVLKKNKLWVNYLSITALTISNPLTIILFMSIFTSAAIKADSVSAANPFIMVFGMWFGSFCAYLLLMTIVSLVRKKSNDKILEWINKISALVLIFFGSVSIYKAIIISAS